MRLKATLYGLAIVACLPAILLSQSVVVPNTNAAVEGNLNNGFPFNLALFSIPSQRYQQVFGSGDFAVFGGPQLITAIRFRPDETGSAFASVLSSVQIDLSTTSAPVDGLSTTFASNVGGDNTTVFSGALSLSSSATGGPPRAFDILITLTTPFVYDPTAGNLLLDVRNFGGGSTTQFDAQSLGGDAVSRAYTFSSGVGSPTADFTDSGGLVTMFEFTAVPEPSTMMLVGAVTLAGGAYFYRRRRNLLKRLAFRL